MGLSITSSKKLVAVLFVFATAVVPALSQVFIIDGKVVSIDGGDSITVVNRRKIRHRVRLAGIAAPAPSQEFNQEATKYLSGMILGKTVKIVGRRFDDNGLLKGKVLLDGRDMNLEQVVAGFAWQHEEFPAEQSARDRQLYEAAEAHARKLKFNLWSGTNPTPPWLFREGRSADR
jgi:endonuclease YncB( thermonuclease family)